MKEYKYNGYTMHATDITTEKHVQSGHLGSHSEIRPLYEISKDNDVVKPASVRPFLTSLRECREEIDSWHYANDPAYKAWCNSPEYEKSIHEDDPFQ